VCLWIRPHFLVNALTNLYETWYTYHGTWAHFSCVLHKSLPSVCVPICVSLLSLVGKGSLKCISPFVASQRFDKHVPAARNTHNSRIVGRLCLCIPLSLVGNSSVKTFPRQRRVVGGVIFCAVCVVSKESRRLVLPKTSAFIWGYSWFFSSSNNEYRTTVWK
jgi:hypothetical protein